MKICTISFKECWRNAEGRWCSDGGFPLQVAAIGDLFDGSKLVIVEVEARAGGIPFPKGMTVVPLRSPRGKDFRRKLSVIAQFPYYIGQITRHVWDADAVYLPVPGDLPFLGLLSSLALRKRVIVRYGSSWVSNSQTTLMNRVTRTLLRWFAGGRNVGLVAGKGDAAPAPRMHWLPSSALSQSELDGIDSTPDRALNDPPSLVYIGRLSPEKNIPHLIQVMSLLKEHGYRPLPRLTLVGGGPQREQLEDVARTLNCTDIVSFAGQLDRRDLSKQLSQADLCVHASATEGSPKAWLDAMAHGLPVLACEVPAARWTIGADGERGWLAPQGDVEAFAAVLRRILTEPCDWPSLRRRARAYVETRTLEAWRERIGEICARQWNMSIVNGKLRAKLPDSDGDNEKVSGHQQSRTNLLAGVSQGTAE